MITAADIRAQLNAINGAISLLPHGPAQDALRLWRDLHRAQLVWLERGHDMREGRDGRARDMGPA